MKQWQFIFICFSVFSLAILHVNYYPSILTNVTLFYSRNLTDNEPQEIEESIIVNEESGLEEDINIVQRIHREQVADRKAYWKRLHPSMRWSQYYDLISLEAICIGKVRIGGMNDGGKWICSPWLIPDDCIFYSLGINNNIQFENALVKLLNHTCSLVGIDQYTQRPATMDSYKKMNGQLLIGRIGTKEEKLKRMGNVTISMDQVLLNNNHTEIDVLKIDIEGAEKTVLPEFLNYIKPCQVLVETHDDIGKTRELLGKISQNGYWLYSWEMNEGSEKACEYSFIHEKCLEKYRVIKLARYLS